MKNNKKYIFILVVCFGILVVLEYNKPKPINWEKTYSRLDKIPYGTFALYERMKDLTKIEMIESNITLYELADQEELIDKNLIFISKKFNPDESDTKLLLETIAGGGTAFIAAEQLDKTIADTLKVEIRDNYFLNENSENYDSTGANFTNTALKNKQDYYFHREANAYYFMSVDTAQTTILGVNTLGGANFVKIKFGEGAFYLHSAPLAFTNYNFLLRNNHQYVSNVFSYLPDNQFIWDEYFKTGRQEAQNILRFILSTEPLRWAWLILLAGLLIFVIFTAKRKQRVIPIVAPPTNASLEFATTIGSLYFQHKDHKNLAEKKINFFMENLRNRYFLPSNFEQTQFLEFISAKSGVAKEEVKKLFALFSEIKNSKTISETTLHELQRAIDSFEV